MLTDETTTRWGRRRSGGLTGLQNQLARLNPGLVGSIPTRSRHRAPALALALLGAAHASTLAGQQPLAGAPQDSAQAVETPGSPGRPSAAGAFVRSMVVPGWGQAVAGSPGRGVFYFTVQSVAVWMILKTTKTLGSASDILAMRRLEALERLKCGSAGRSRRPPCGRRRRFRGGERVRASANPGAAERGLVRLRRVLPAPRWCRRVRGGASGGFPGTAGGRHPSASGQGRRGWIQTDLLGLPCFEGRALSFPEHQVATVADPTPQIYVEAARPGLM